MSKLLLTHRAEHKGIGLKMLGLSRERRGGVGSGGNFALKQDGDFQQN